MIAQLTRTLVYTRAFCYALKHEFTHLVVKMYGRAWPTNWVHPAQALLRRSAGVGAGVIPFAAYRPS